MSLSKDIAYSFLWRGVTISANLFNSILLARMLSVEARGTYALVILTITLIVLVANFGVPDASIFFLGEKKFSQTEVCTTSLLFNLITASILTLICWLFIIFQTSFLFNPLDYNIYLIAILAILPLSLTTQIRLALLGMKQITRYNQLMTLDVVILFSWIIILSALQSFNIQIAILAFVASAYTNFIYNIFSLNQKIKLSFSSVRWKLIQRSIQFGKQFFMIGIGGFLVQRVNFKFLEQYHNATSVGYYAVAGSLPNLFSIIPSQLATILYPWIANSKDDAERFRLVTTVFKSTLVICLLILLGFIPLVKFFLVLLYGNNYSHLALPTVLLMVSSILSGSTNILINFMSGIGKPKVGTYLTVMNLLSLIVFGFFFIPNGNVLGAVIAKLCTDVVGMIFLFFLFYKTTAILPKHLLIITKSDFALFFVQLNKIKKRFFPAH